MFEVMAVHRFRIFVFVFENIPTVSMLVLREAKNLRMAFGPKGKFLTSRERENLLQQLYHNIEGNE